MKKDNARIPVAKKTEKSLAVIKTSLTILSAEASKTDQPIGRIMFVFQRNNSQ